MSVFDNTNDQQAITPSDLNVLRVTLEVWCAHEKITQKDASMPARVLIDAYKNGKRSQVELIDALVESTRPH